MQDASNKNEIYWLSSAKATYLSFLMYWVFEYIRTNSLIKILTVELTS
jgi:hypothetical protein